MVSGDIATFEPVPVSANELLMQGASMLTYNSNLLSQTHTGQLADSARRALELVADGRIDIDVTAEYELADVETAIAHLAGGATAARASSGRDDAAPGPPWTLSGSRRWRPLAAPLRDGIVITARQNRLAPPPIEGSLHEAGRRRTPGRRLHRHPRPGPSSPPPIRSRR
ncbi:hypothetical protein [Nonomuraea dietziae]|uniref:Uncharacterized protein n=1 Tax=Nonomuraea dietziae TaxID=65515 RepID=A0A7W5VHV5_9ACTN|nr:hypothetical protein [Nonomuraea dietziae]MBB3728102.1 hypothetical protein [Nonomuraea dietziae]